jgi:cysteinyl-tRNA synthetase
LGNILGILTEKPHDYLEKKKRRALDTIGLTEEEINALIEKRQEARRQKNWAEADKIRNELLEKGIILKDGPTGTEWTVK